MTRASGAYRRSCAAAPCAQRDDTPSPTKRHRPPLSRDRNHIGTTSGHRGDGPTDRARGEPAYRFSSKADVLVRWRLRFLALGPRRAFLALRVEDEGLHGQAVDLCVDAALEGADRPAGDAFDGLAELADGRV